MSTVNQVKVGSTTYDMSPAPSGTLVAVGSTSWTSGDAASPTAWTSVNAITTSDANNTIFNKITSMVKNVRYLYTKLGTTDFSAVGSTTSAALVALNNGKSATTHNHNSVYAAKSHSHNNYASSTHNHDSTYAAKSHSHNNYASSTHNHDSAYAAKSHSHSDYSLTTHTHSDYATTGHTHSDYSLTTHTHSTYFLKSNIVTTQTNSTTKVPAASLVKSMNDTLTSLNNAWNVSNYTDSSFWSSVKSCTDISGTVIVYSASNTVLLNSTLTFNCTAYVPHGSSVCLLRGKYGTSSTIETSVGKTYVLNFSLKQSPSGIEIWASSKDASGTYMSGSYTIDFSSNQFSIHYA